MFWKRKKERPISSESIIQDALSRLRKINDEGFRLLTLPDISKALSETGEIERALDVGREIEALRFALNPESIDGARASVLSNVSKALAEAGEIKRAKSMIEEALSITNEIDALLDISVALATVGETEKALDMARGISYEPTRSSALSGISEALIKTGEIEKAKEVVKEALDIARVISSDWYRIKSLSFISVVLAKAGELEKAKGVIEEALGIAERIHDRTKQPDVDYCLALVEVVGGLAEIGETGKALDIVSRIDFDRDRVHAFSSISKVFVKDGEIEKAKEIIQKALSITNGISDDWLASNALSKIYVPLHLIEQAQNVKEINVNSPP